jgi:TonB-dependent Receptor Plug Domain
MKVGAIQPAIRQTAFAAAVGVNLLIAPKVPAQGIVPAAAASLPPAQVTTGATAEVERVIVTGSNIPTAEEVGPNPVDTYRPADIEKLGIRNPTDLQTFLPQEAGGTTNLNMGSGGDGTVQFNLRGLLPKETLVLVDGKRLALGSLNPVGFSGGVDINLLPFPMIDHIDILKDGASAVYGSDAIAGVVNFFWSISSVDWRLEAVTGTPTWEPLTTWANGRHGLKPALETIRRKLWSLLTSGSVPVASSAPIGTCPVTPFKSPGAEAILAVATPAQLALLISA